MALTRLRWRLDALVAHVQRAGNACDDHGLALRQAVLEEAARVFYRNGKALGARVGEARDAGIVVAIRGGEVWLMLADMVEGEGGIVGEWEKVPGAG